MYVCVCMHVFVWAYACVCLSVCMCVYLCRCLSFVCLLSGCLYMTLYLGVWLCVCLCMCINALLCVLDIICVCMIVSFFMIKKAHTSFNNIFTQVKKLLRQTFVHYVVCISLDMYDVLFLWYILFCCRKSSF